MDPEFHQKDFLEGLMYHEIDMVDLTATLILIGKGEQQAKQNLEVRKSSYLHRKKNRVCNEWNGHT